jgi:predicted enzyme related to lactoylglutathione lyase
LKAMKDIQGMITFTYHEDIEAADRFYGKTLGLKRVMDRYWVKIFKLGVDSHVGLVDSKRGYLKPSDDKPVMLTIIVEDAEAWHRMLTEKGVETNHPPRESDEIHMKGFLTWDPSGYVIEILEFLTKPYGE